MSMKEKIIGFIESKLLESTVEIGYEDDLLNSGLLDSIAVIKLIAYIEEEFGIAVPPEEMVIENFVSVKAIEDFLNSIN